MTQTPAIVPRNGASHSAYSLGIAL
jgi:hypothetical protein